MHDVITLAGDIIPGVDAIVNRIIDYNQIHLEREAFTNDEFDAYKSLYWMPDGLRAYVYCYMKSEVSKLPKLPVLV